MCMQQFEDGFNRRQGKHNPFRVHENQPIRKRKNVEVCLEGLSVSRDACFVLDILKEKTVVVITRIVN